MNVELTFTEPLLGTLAGNKEIAEEFIAGKHPAGKIADDEAEAIDNIEEEIEKQSTIFPKDEKGNPFLWDYQVKGFFKEACEAMIHSDTLTQEKLKILRLTFWMHKKTIDKQIFVKPRRIFLEFPRKGKLKEKFNQRPLRGMTQRGERICLTRSEEAPAGTKIKMEIRCGNEKLVSFVKRWLDWGILFGMGQWRTSGMGRFSWQEFNGKKQ